MNNFLHQLNKQQLEAVTHDNGPAVVLAGAGSGKTRVLTTRAAWLIDQQQAQPDQILLVTFTNKAAAEMNSRVQKLTGHLLPYSGTFHSFCAKILRRQGEKVGLNNHYLIYDSNDQSSLIKSIIKELNLNTKKYKHGMVHGLISKAKNELVDVQNYAQQADNEFERTIARVYKLYQHQLQKQNAVDFDDLLFKVVQLFSQNNNVLSQYQERLTHILVDEYQDTNKAQYQLTKMLAQPQNQLYVVGDFSQSIYAWRGADYRNLHYLQNDYQSIKEYKLEQNYRSIQPILSAATELISNNTTHPVLNLWTSDSTDDTLTIIEASSSDQESLAVSREIKNLLNQGFRYEDIAILYRTNAQSRSFEEAFIKKGIPYRLIGGFKFYERKEIKDVLAYLRLVVNPLDMVSFERAQKNGKRRYQKFKKWLDKQQAENKLNFEQPYQLLKSILKASKYTEKYNPKDSDDEERLQNIEELLNVAAQFSDTILFLENVSLVQDNDLKDAPADEQNNKITLMSLHSAKGLEFPVVFMVGMEEGLLPHSRCMFDHEQLEEERRLCYVGITRAEKKLYFTHANHRWLYGQNKQSSPSRFLSQIPQEIVVRKYCGGLEDDGYAKKRYGNGGQSWGKYSKKSSPSTNLASKKKSKKKYRIGIEIDEDELDALLKDEIDIEDFLNQ